MRLVKANACEHLSVPARSDPAAGPRQPGAHPLTFAVTVECVQRRYRIDRGPQLPRLTASGCSPFILCMHVGLMDKPLMHPTSGSAYEQHQGCAETQLPGQSSMHYVAFVPGVQNTLHAVSCPMMAERLQPARTAACPEGLKLRSTLSLASTGHRP